jgi:hypothetical protein
MFPKMFYQPTRRHIPIESRILRRHRRKNPKSHKTNSKHISLPGFSEDNKKKRENFNKIVTKKSSANYAFFILKTFSPITREYSNL